MKGLTIDPDVLGFLSDLKQNNDRDWFKSNQSRYERAKDNFLTFTNGLIAAIAEFDSSIGTLEAKDCHFRIYRDVRFSKNKDPYKTNMGAYIAKGGRKSQFAGYYFHIEPNDSFISGGIYMAQPQVLKKIRSEMETYSDSFLEIVTEKNFKKTFESLGNESLKKVPQGFSSDSPVAEYLKLKHITPYHPVSDNILLNENLFEKVVGVFKVMHPIIAFLNTAIEHE